MSEPRVEIPGSAPKPLAGALGPADPNQRITITVLVRRAPSSRDVSSDLLAGKYQPLPREDAAAITAAGPADLSAVTSFLQHYGLRIIGQNPPARTLQAEGAVKQMETAFNVNLLKCRAADGSEYLSHEGPIFIPQTLSGIIVAVLGFDQRRIAEPR